MEDSEDKKIWELFTSGITPMSPSNKKSASEEEVVLPSKKKEKAVYAPQPVPVTTVKKSQAKPLAMDDLSALDGASARKIRAGNITLHGRLDLHGCTLAQAQELLSGFIHNAHLQGKKYLLVVTGKGKENKGAIRSSIASWLNTPTLREYILAAGFSHIKHGGQGAVYIVLKKKR
jgi:DNA-nicking Smr family endonuclease